MKTLQELAEKLAQMQKEADEVALQLSMHALEMRKAGKLGLAQSLESTVSALDRVGTPTGMLAMTKIVVEKSMRP